MKVGFLATIEAQKQILEVYKEANESEKPLLRLNIGKDVLTGNTKYEFFDIESAEVTEQDKMLSFPGADFIVNEKLTSFFDGVKLDYNFKNNKFYFSKTDDNSTT